MKKLKWSLNILKFLFCYSQSIIIINTWKEKKRKGTNEKKRKNMHIEFKTGKVWNKKNAFSCNEFITLYVALCMHVCIHMYVYSLEFMRIDLKTKQKKQNWHELLQQINRGLMLPFLYIMQVSKITMNDCLFYFSQQQHLVSWTDLNFKYAISTLVILLIFIFELVCALCASTDDLIKSWESERN